MSDRGKCHEKLHRHNETTFFPRIMNRAWIPLQKLATMMLLYDLSLRCALSFLLVSGKKDNFSLSNTPLSFLPTCENELEAYHKRLVGQSSCKHMTYVFPKTRVEAILFNKIRNQALKAYHRRRAQSRFGKMRMHSEAPRASRSPRRTDRWQHGREESVAAR
jgi:hypothetical protein